MAQQLELLLDLTNKWVWTIDLAGTHTFSTTAVTDILGYTPAELVGRNALEFLHEEDRRMVEQRRPGLKGLFMSGYSSDVFVREKLPADTELIQKPFSAADLSETLGRMLGHES